MERNRPVGRARVRNRADRPADQPRTSVLRLDAEPPPPVFVDASGRRRRRVRRFAYGAAVAVVLLLLLLWLSQLGAPVRPAPARPCPTASHASGSCGQR